MKNKKRWMAFSWHSSKYKCNMYRAKLTWPTFLHTLHVTHWCMSVNWNLFSTRCNVKKDVESHLIVFRVFHRSYNIVKKVSFKFCNVDKCIILILDGEHGLIFFAWKWCLPPTSSLVGNVSLLRLKITYSVYTEDLTWVLMYYWTSWGKGCEAVPSILSVFPNESNKFNNTGAGMQDSIYHDTKIAFY